MTFTDTWGYPVNGSWTGLTGFLQREEADIGATGMFVLKERLPVVHFITATTSTRYLYRSDTNTFQNLIFSSCKTKIIVKFVMLLEWLLFRLPVSGFKSCVVLWADTSSLGRHVSSLETIKYCVCLYGNAEGTCNRQCHEISLSERIFCYSSIPMPEVPEERF